MEPSEIQKSVVNQVEKWMRHAENAQTPVRTLARRGARSRPLSEHQRFINRLRSGARARVEHIFHVVKRLWGFSKVRYRGLAKNTARLYTAFALANLYLLRRRLLPQQWSYAP
jgi:IS5 family transposase